MRSSAPGSRPASHAIWKPLQMREHRAAALGVRDDLLHDRAEARDGAGAQVVAVAESTRQDDDVAALQIVILVPQ